MNSFDEKNALRLLGSGLDTQGYSLVGDTANFEPDRWDSAIDFMREHKTKWHNSGDVDKEGFWVLRDYKHKGKRFVFELKGGEAGVFVNPKYKFSPVVVQLNSKGLYANGGHEALHEVVKNFLPNIGIDCGDSEAKVYRQDVNWDIVVPPDFELDTKNIYAPKRKRRLVEDEELGVETLAVGERGKEHAYLRMYVKTHEIEEKGTIWQIPILESNGWLEGERVIRVELELGGDFLKEFGPRNWGPEFKTLLRDVVLKLVTESFQVVAPYERGKDPNLNRKITRLPFWELVVADARSLSTKEIKRIKVPVYGDRVARALKRLDENLLSIKAMALQDGWPAEIIEQEILSRNSKTWNKNLIEQKEKRLRWARKLYLREGEK